MNEAQQAQDMIKAVYEDKEAEINGRKYQLTNTTHSQRVKVFSFYSSVQHEMRRQDFSFLTLDKFKQIEKIVNEIVMFDEVGMNNRKNHWEEFPEDYITYIMTMIPAISYPLLKGSNTN
jgi:hypothetical protein